MSRPKGSHLTEEHKRKISESSKGLTRTGRPKGYKMSDEAKERISNANKGRQTRLGYKASEETKHKMSLSHIGLDCPHPGMKDKYHTEETKLKMSLSHKLSFLNNPILAINASSSIIPYLKYGYLLIINGILFDSIRSAERFYGFSRGSLRYLIKNNQSLLYKKYGLSVDYISEDIVKKNRKSEEFEILKKINS